MGVAQKIGVLPVREMQAGKRRAVFFDRDGVILKAVLENGKPRPPYSRREYDEKSGLMPGAREAIEAVRALGFLAILASNQPDVHYGNITQADFDWIQARVAAFPFDDIVVCPHGREEGCACKKPKPGMLIAAAKKWDIDLSHSFLVGDTKDDVGAAMSAGCASIMLTAPYNVSIASDLRVASLHELTRVLHTEELL